MAANPVADGLAAHLVALGNMPAAPDQFWQSYRAFVKQSLEAAQIEVYTREIAGASMAWRSMFPSSHSFEQRVPPSLLEAARHEGVALGQNMILAILPSAEGAHEVAMLVLFGPNTRPEPRLAKVAFLANVPLIYERSRERRLAARDALRLSQALVLIGNLSDAADFNAAVTLLANRLAELFACEQVYITWRRAVGQRLVAVSHGDLPSQRSTQAALVEEMAQEALTQQSEVLYPIVESSSARSVAAAAARFAESARPGNIIVLPMLEYSAAGEILEHGAVALTRRSRSFTEAEQWALRLFMDMSARFLVDKFHTKRLLPVRIWAEIARSSPKIMQVQTQPGRILLGSLAAALFILMIVPIPYSVSATAVLKARTVAFVGAPYNGYTQSSTVQLGGVVAKGDSLVQMATDELLLERQTRLAELAQANRDAEINRAQGKLPQMQQARAQAEQIKAQLALLDQRLAAANVLAPISGVIVDGEPSKQIGQAVSRGDMLVTIAQLDGLYVEAAVPERDLNLVKQGATATLTLLSNPDAAFDVTVNRAIPSVSQQDAQNVFPVRFDGPEQPADWWLPGMTGVVRIDTGYAPVAWALTRRLTDYLRLWLWI
jgi:hypothetical protein